MHVTEACLLVSSQVGLRWSYFVPAEAIDTYSSSIARGAHCCWWQLSAPIPEKMRKGYWVNISNPIQNIRT